MKLERLIGILAILLQREKVTAPELAPSGPSCASWGRRWPRNTVIYRDAKEA